MTGQEFLGEYAKWFPENRKLCDEHVSDFPEILSHIFAGQAVFDEMKRAFQNGDTERFGRFCEFIDHIWNLVKQNDDDEILNVISVTLLESISDDNTMWREFGRFINNAFKDYINNEVLIWNVLMASVEKLR